MPSTYCKTVWNGLHIQPDGYIRLCSLGANSVPELDMQRARDRDGNLMNIATHEVKDMINSDKHREVRRLNVEKPGEWSPHCVCCENREKIVRRNDDIDTSRRQALMFHVRSPGLNEFTLKDNMEKDGSVNWGPSSLDIRFGNLCNQKCIMCGPHFSNLWYEEWADFYKTDKIGFINEKIQIVRDPVKNKFVDPEEFKWHESPQWWAKFEEMCPTLSHIYITGGEPMVTPSHDVMLDKLIANGYAKKITLEYDTNLSAINNKILERWPNFKKVIVRASMDGTGDQYELIRFGGNWNKFVENVKRLKAATAEFPHIKFESVSSCVQLSTLYEIEKSEKFCEEMDVPFHIRFLEGPVFFSLNHIPRKYKLELIEYYKTLSGTKPPLIIKYLENNLDYPIREDSMQRCIEFMDFLDTTRNTNWKKVLPEMYALLKRMVDNPK